MSRSNDSLQRRHAWMLGGLLLLFALRVLGQWVQSIHPLPVLPDFDRWMSGALPYPLLLVCQLFILVALSSIIIRWYCQSVRPSLAWGRLLGILGSLYFAVMFIRLVVGVLFESAPAWFDYPIPAFFHLVLAAFPLVMSRYHLRSASA